MELEVKEIRERTTKKGKEFNILEGIGKEGKIELFDWDKHVVNSGALKGCIVEVGVENGEYPKITSCVVKSGKTKAPAIDRDHMYEKMMVAAELAKNYELSLEDRKKAFLEMLKFVGEQWNKS